MPPQQRAKQFQPFAALSGLEASLRRKEREMEKQERPVLSEDEAELINRELSALQKNDRMLVTFFRSGEIRTVCGEADPAGLSGGYLQVGEEQILLRDILRAERET